MKTRPFKRPNKQKKHATCNHSVQYIQLKLAPNLCAYTGSIHPFNLYSAGAMGSFESKIRDKNISLFIFVEDNFLPVWHYGSILSYLFRSLSSLTFKELTRNNISLVPLWEGQSPLVSNFVSRSSHHHHYLPVHSIITLFEYFSLLCPQCLCFISLWITPVFRPPLEQWPVMTSVNNINFPWKLCPSQKL